MLSREKIMSYHISQECVSTMYLQWSKYKIDDPNSDIYLHVCHNVYV